MVPKPDGGGSRKIWTAALPAPRMGGGDRGDTCSESPSHESGLEVRGRGTVDNTLSRMHVHTWNQPGPDTEQVFNQLMWLNQDLAGQNMKDDDLDREPPAQVTLEKKWETND